MPSPLFPLPAEPMAPLSNSSLPEGSDWTYQLKWDGVRILAALRDGQIQLWSRKLLLKNAVYPEVELLLRARLEALGSCVLDGEVVYWDGNRPNFQKVLQRERSRHSVKPDAEALHNNRTLGENSAPGSGTNRAEAFVRQEASGALVNPAGTTAAQGLLYVLFDLIWDGDRDLRPLPFSERQLHLKNKLSGSETERFFVTDCFADGNALWSWVQEHGWEGVVSKRLQSPYREGKKHKDWLKKKTKVVLDVDMVGVKLRDGQAASLVMSYGGCYLGSVSLGLDGAMLKVLSDTARQITASGTAWPMPFGQLPSDLKKETVVWLPVPVPGRVTGLEITSAGQLRHPKLVSFGTPGAAR